MIPLKNIASLRFISMSAIVFMHFIGTLNSHFLKNDCFLGSKLDFIFYSGLINLTKFATIVFFIISGFLFELNSAKYKSFKAFIKNKYEKLLKPYILIFLLPTIAFLIFIKPHAGIHETLTLRSFVTEVFAEVFLSTYWFIPTLFLYFIINFFLPLKRVKYLLFLSLLITCFYSLNLYHPIVTTNHTVTVLGFLSFFLLGRVFCKLPSNIKINSWTLSVAFFVISLFISILESYILNYSFSQNDFLNTLKLSNIFYAFSVLFLLKDRISISAALLKVDTFFVYLFHPHLVRIVSFLVLHQYITASSKVIAVLYAVICMLMCFFAQKIYTIMKTMFTNEKTISFNLIQAFNIKTKLYK